SAIAVSESPSVIASASPKVFPIGGLLRKSGSAFGKGNCRAGTWRSRCFDFAYTWRSPWRGGRRIHRGKTSHRGEAPQLLNGARSYSIPIPPETGRSGA